MEYALFEPLQLSECKCCPWSLQVNAHHGRSRLVATFTGLTQADGIGWQEVPEMRIVCVVSNLYTFWDSQLLRALGLEA